MITRPPAQAAVFVCTFLRTLREYKNDNDSLVNLSPALPEHAGHRNLPNRSPRGD